ncbi:collagen-like protein [Sporosarcina sp. Te-1]|uniref:collagen-like protein n=1 Tax=Sporosarcina sp. Te-1 TaxID=2818390 RepID=UPI001A9E7A18|nr:collagen-like protein [Sporosarcina sp. Te-1]QTD42731.1 collagen-like protein [Sporosarcina sp. Te-1]
MDNCSNCNNCNQCPCLCRSQLGPFSAVDLCGIPGVIPVIPTACSGLCEYGYIYNLSPEVVAVEADIIFDSTGIVTPGITHIPGTSQIFITSPGVYEVTFSVSGVEPNQFTLYLNGAPLPETVYGSGAGTQQNNGQAIIAIPSGGILTLRNHSSAAAVILQTLAGGTQTNVNASIILKMLSPVVQ